MKNLCLRQLINFNFLIISVKVLIQQVSAQKDFSLTLPTMLKVSLDRWSTALLTLQIKEWQDKFVSNR